MKPRNIKNGDPKKSSSDFQTSDSLILGIKNDQPEAWSQMVKLYSPLVYFWCNQSGLAKTDVEDVFQEVFHAVAKNIEKYRCKANGSFRAWLRTMTRNKVIDHFRTAAKLEKPAGGTEALQFLTQFPDHSAQQLPFESILLDSQSSLTSLPVQQSTGNSTASEVKLIHNMLREALISIRDQFTEKTWRAFWMVAVDGRETKDVAVDLEMKPGTVRVAKSRVLKRLKMEIGDAIQDSDF